MVMAHNQKYSKQCLFHLSRHYNSHIQYMQDSELPSEIKLEAKLEPELAALPPRTTPIHNPPAFQTLLTNAIHFQIHQPHHQPAIHIYTLQIIPEITDNNKNKPILEHIHRRLAEKLIQFAHISKRIIIASELCTENKRLIKVVYNNTPIQVWLHHRRSVRFGKSSDNLAYRNGSRYLRARLCQALVQLGWSNAVNKGVFYIPKPAIIPLSSCYALNCFHTSLLWCDSRAFLMVKPSIKIVKDSTVLNEINQFYKANITLSKAEKHRQLNQTFKGRHIIANYGKKCIYIIDSIQFQQKVGTIFLDWNDKQKNQSSKISLLDFYKKKYDLQVTHTSQPLIKARSTACLYLIPEFTSFILNKQQLKQQNIQSFAKVKQQEYFQQNQQFMLNLKEPLDENPLHLLSQVGITLSHQYEKVKAYLLEYPKITAGADEVIDIFKGREFDYEGKRIYSCKHELNICIISPAALDFDSIRKQVLACAEKKAIACNLTPYSYLIQATDKMLNNIKQIIQLEKYEYRQSPTNLFWIIIPTEFKHLYSQIKRLTFNCNIETLSQVTLTSTFSMNERRKAITSIFQQMTAKIGNPLWSIAIPPQQQILLIGIAQGQSYAAYCSNTDANISAFHSGFYQIDPQSSLSMHIRQIVQSCLKHYFESNQSAPSEVIILRFESRATKEEEQAEIRQIHHALPEFMINKAGIRYYAVSQSCSLDLYLQKGSQLCRPYQGLLINEHIVQKESFYLLNERGRQHATVAMHYRAIYSKSCFGGYPFQQFIYDQTFNYYNYQGSTFIPGVLKYAKRLAITLSIYDCNSQVYDKLADKLYYL